MKKPEWILFKLDDVIIDETAAWQDRISRTAAANGISEKVLLAEMERAASDNLPEYSEALKRLNISRCEPFDHAYDRLYDDAEDALYSLCGKYRLGVIADRPADTWELLGKLGVLKYFDAVTLSAEVGFSHPNELVLREALYKARSLPQRCVMIGSKLDEDIACAKRMGMITVWVRRGFGRLNTITNVFKGPDYTVENILQAAEIFADW